MRNKTRSYNKKKILKIIVSVVIIITIFVYTETHISSSLKDVSVYYCKQYALNVINKSVNEILNETDLKYSDFTVLLYDENNNIVSAKALTQNINSVQTMISFRISEKLSNEIDNTIKIPFGTISRFYLLNGRGPEIKIKFMPCGNVETNLQSSFSSAGINQTYHKIIMDITVNITAIYPGGNVDTSTHTSCILAENIIVGDVPQGLMDIGY